ncbi:hypothetical protein [Umezawaea tangerina]|uniref:Uncharacterized protein n=1 Tax=Umezawaea tangerina TaxID=84725 RepID=A0A2T0SZY2_9PSEU|nr:hypothetical protein [Umezawaea tangerina]PRY38971.1 hypothetical protein CLV43_108371 [Umezawaea tangerina]
MTTVGESVVPYYGPGSNHPPADTSWQGPADGYYSDQFVWGSLPKASENATSGVSVNTDALRMFAQNLRSLLVPLKAAQDSLEGMRLAPGGFFDAYALVGKVLGSGAGAGEAIQPTTLDFIKKAVQAVTIAADELEGLARQYKSAEELNAATGHDVEEYIQGAKAYIGNAVGVAPGLT